MIDRSQEMSCKYVCAFRGSRDHYQAAVALSEVDRLDMLITDFYTPDWLLSLAGGLGGDVGSRLARRRAPGISSRLTKNRLRSAVPLSSGRFNGHKVDDGLGSLAARRTSHGALIYSYYWHGFRQTIQRGESEGPHILFQVHPFASQIKRVLTADRERSGVDEALEPEERLSDEQITAREAELLTADAIIATSQFVRSGILDASSTRVPVALAPYGATENRESPTPVVPTLPPPGPTRLLWVGQLAYRKGAHWLVKAMRAMSPSVAHLTIVSRQQPPPWLGPLPDNVTVLSGVSNHSLGLLFGSHDIFVLPSLVEGFGLVYLEALGQGLPILGTANSGVPDIIETGEQGIVVSAGSVASIVTAIESLHSDPALLAHLRMGVHRLRLPTWEGFRSDVRAALMEAEQTAIRGAS